MAKKVVKKKSIVKKYWKKIVAPKMFGEAVIGETYVAEPEKSLGKKMSVSMMQVTGEPKKQNISLTFQMEDLKDDKFTTKITGFKLTVNAVKRIMARKRNKIDSSFLAKTKDGKRLRIKTVAVTKARAKGSVLAALQNSLKEYTIREIANAEYDNLFGEVIQKSLQKKIQGNLKKIYPVTTFDLRWIEYLPTKEELAKK